MTHPFHYIIYDIETAGLGPGTAKEPKSIIMEIAFIVINEKLEEVDRLEFYLKPYIDNPVYSPGALSTHNIPIQRTIDEGLLAKDAINQIIDLFKKYSKGARKKPVIVGHNIDKFDNKFMDVFFSIHKKEFKKIYEFSIDTLDWAHLKYGQIDSMVNFKLGTACSAEDISIIGAHRAMKDVEANTKLIIKYLSDLRSDSSNSTQQEEIRVREKFYF